MHELEPTWVSAVLAVVALLVGYACWSIEKASLSPSIQKFIFLKGQTVLHVRTGEVYGIIDVPDIASPNKSDASCYAYRSISGYSHVIQYCDRRKMEDGRFINWVKPTELEETKDEEFIQMV